MARRMRPNDACLLIHPVEFADGGKRAPDEPNYLDIVGGLRGPLD